MKIWITKKTLRDIFSAISCCITTMINQKSRKFKSTKTRSKLSLRTLSRGTPLITRIKNYKEQLSLSNETVMMARKWR